MNNSPSTSSSVATVRILEDQDIVTVIERFEVSAGQQQEAVERATDHVTKEWKENSEFVAAVLLRGHEPSGLAPSKFLQGIGSGGISSYSQWRLPADASAPVAVPEAWSLADALSAFKTLDSRTYAVEFTGWADSKSSPTLLSLDQTPFAHFGIFSVTQENQGLMLDLAREHGPDSFGTPGLLSINFHRSVDGLEVINLGTWNSLEGLDALIQTPGFEDDSVYWEGIADFQPGFFDVVLVEVRQ